MLTAPDLIQAAGQATRRLNEREAEARGSSLAAEAEAREIAAALEALEAKKRWDDPAIYDRDALVIDCGSCLSRGGMSSAARPAAVVRTQACKLDDMTRNGVQPWHGGDEVDRLRKKLWDQTRTASKCTDAALDLRVPLRVGGLVNDWDAMEEVWRYFVQRRLRGNGSGNGSAARSPGPAGSSAATRGEFVDFDGVAEATDPFDGPNVLLADATLNTGKERERRAEILFESVGARSLCTPPEALLALYSEGRTTGLVLDIGHDVAHAVPVIEGYVDRSCAALASVGGIDIGKVLTVQAKVAAKKERGVKTPATTKAYSGLSAYQVPVWVRMYFQKHLSFDTEFSHILPLLLCVMVFIHSRCYQTGPTLSFHRRARRVARVAARRRRPREGERRSR